MDGKFELLGHLIVTLYYVLPQKNTIVVVAEF